MILLFEYAEKKPEEILESIIYPESGKSLYLCIDSDGMLFVQSGENVSLYARDYVEFCSITAQEAADLFLDEVYYDDNLSPVRLKSLVLGLFKKDKFLRYFGENIGIFKKDGGLDK
jgi:hypothetical protein